jgi:hypothetical protein
MRADQRVAGVLRFMSYEPKRSAAGCTVCRCRLASWVSARVAGQIARDHARDTGHETRAWHTQVVTYRRETP